MLNPCYNISMAWKSVVGFEGLYEVSDDGRVRGLERRSADDRYTVPAKELKGSLDGNGYKVVALSKNGFSLRKYVHVAVLEAFSGPRPEGFDGCHSNGDNQDNRAANLRWDSRKENMRDAMRHGTHVSANKTHCIRGHELSPANNARSNSKRRECLACSNEHHNARRQGREFDRSKADEEYARLVLQGRNTHNEEKTHCPRMHPLEEGNLVLSVLRRGGRSCLACSRARAYAQRNSAPFDPRIADDYFEKAHA